MHGYDDVVNFLNFINKDKNIIPTEEPFTTLELVKDFNDTLIYEIRRK